MRVDTLDLRLVRAFALTRRHRGLRAWALGVNFLGNGWVYIPLAAALFVVPAGRPWLVLASAALATAAAHACYRTVKPRARRRRPFDRDPALEGLGQVLDRYSFPSGHCMTLTAVLVPIARDAPALLLPASLALATLAWGRLAAAHHYPSDVLAGIGLGAAVSVPIAAWLLPG